MLSRRCPRRGLPPHMDALRVGAAMSHDVGHPADDLRVHRSEDLPAAARPAIPHIARYRSGLIDRPNAAPTPRRP